MDSRLLPISLSSSCRTDGGTRPSQGRPALSLTRHRDEELDSITVAVETELCLSHGAVGNEAAGRFVTVVITIHVDDPTRAAALSRGW